MYIKSLKIKNYKGFRESPDIPLSRGINVIVGQNNAGKTALIEALGLFPLGVRPHKFGPTIKSPSSLSLTLSITGAEFVKFMSRSKESPRIVFPPDAFETTSQSEYLEAMTNASELVLELNYTHSGQWSTQQPGLKLPEFDTKSPKKAPMVTFKIANERIVGVSPYGGPQIETLGDHFGPQVGASIFMFKAERLNAGHCPIADGTQLSNDASNLPSVLLRLRSNKNRYDRFEKLVQEVFPWINHVSARIRPGTRDIAELVLWTHDVDSENEALAIHLEDSGTGVAQVVAILCLLVTATDRTVVAIDEPQTFLHPGAAKKLMGILSRQRDHQIIVSTHSPEIIRASHANRLIRLFKNGHETAFESLQGSDLKAMASLLGEMGVQLTDVFGADAILWVEGQTEALSVPLLFPHFKARPSAGIAVNPLRNTGDIEQKGLKARALLAIYRNLSRGNALLPPAVAFCLDGEDKTASEIADLQREMGNDLHFLPRRSIENYLLDPDAISVLFNETVTFHDHPITASTISDWLIKNGGNSKFRASEEWDGRLDTEGWVQKVDAPNLLSRMMSELSEAREEYSKTKHSIRLLEIILETNPDSAKELIDHFERILS